MSTVFVAGKQYRVVVTQHPYVVAGSIVTYLDNGRFLVKWCDGASDTCRNGDKSLVGYDAQKQVYELHLQKEFIVEYTNDVDEQRLADIMEAIDNLESISSDDMRWYTSHVGEWVAGYILCLDTDEYEHKDNAHLCPVGGAWYSSNCDFVTAYDRNGDDISAHYESLDDSSEFFQCARSGAYYSRRYYSCVYVADQDEYWCLEDNEYDIEFCDDDGNYYFDTDNMPRSSRIPSYHSQQMSSDRQSRNWRKIPDGVTLGVELEVYVDDADQAYANRASDIIGERDGSLCRVHGVEFIGAPMNYEDYFRFRNPWDVTLEAINDAGVGEDSHYDRKDGYGMHISVGRKSLTSDIQARFVLFVNNCQDFSEFIAQRSSNRWAAYDKKDVNHVRESFNTSGTREWGSKYSATHIDKERIEVRIFKSVTEPELFKKNIDYVYSAVMFVVAHTDIADVISVQKYLSWLNEQEGYGALKAFIGDNGKRFSDSDSRRLMLTQNGFIIEESDNDSTV